MREHQCVTWCRGRLRGVIENQQLIGHVPETWQFEVLSVKQVAHDPDNRGFTVRCQHNKLYYLKRVDHLGAEARDLAQQEVGMASGGLWRHRRRRTDVPRLGDE